jgi:hypothetical protein
VNSHWTVWRSNYPMEWLVSIKYYGAMNQWHDFPWIVAARTALSNNEQSSTGRKHPCPSSCAGRIFIVTTTMTEVRSLLRKQCSLYGMNRIDYTTNISCNIWECEELPISVIIDSINTIFLKELTVCREILTFCGIKNFINLMFGIPLCFLWQ